MKLRLSYRGRALALGLLFAGAFGASPARADEKDIERARELCKLLFENKYEEFAKGCDDTMKAAFTAEHAKQMTDNVRFQFGKFQGITKGEEAKSANLDAVRLSIRFERGSLALRFVFSADDKLSGLWMDAILPDETWTAPAYVKPEAFSEQSVTVKAGAFELPGKLCLPKASGKYPAVVLVHGSGPHDEDETIIQNKPFRDLGQGLASRGIATLRYEKRTHKYKQGVKAEDVTLEFEVLDDALAAVELLRGRPEVDPKRIYVLGHSLGGFSAPLIAERDGKLAGIVLLAGNSRPILDLLEEQLEYISKVDGDVSDEEREQMKKVHQAADALRAGRPEDVKDPLLGAPNSYWMDLNRRDQVAAAQKLTIPILIINGGRDYQVPKADFDLWKQKLEGRKNATFKMHERLNHLMIAGDGKPAPGDYQTAGHVDEPVINDIAEWIGAAPSRDWMTGPRHGGASPPHKPEPSVPRTRGHPRAWRQPV